MVGGRRGVGGSGGGGGVPMQSCTHNKAGGKRTNNGLCAFACVQVESSSAQMKPSLAPSSSTGFASEPQKSKTKTELWNIIRMKGVVTPLCHPSRTLSHTTREKERKKKRLQNSCGSPHLTNVCVLRLLFLRLKSDGERAPPLFTLKLKNQSGERSPGALTALCCSISAVLTELLCVLEVCILAWPARKRE